MYRAGEEILLAVSCGDYLPLPERIEEGKSGKENERGSDPIALAEGVDEDQVIYIGVRRPGNQEGIGLLQEVVGVVVGEECQRI